MAIGTRAILERVTQRLRGVYGGRPWLVATDDTSTATSLVRDLRGLGAERCLVIAAVDAGGERPDPRDADVHVLGVPAGGGAMAALRRARAALADVPVEVGRAVDAFDRYGRLRTVGNVYADGSAVAGRPAWGARPATWQALEDKTRVDALWDASGVRRAPSAVVPFEPEALAVATAALDRGHGVVWAADDTLGFHGGATYTRPVRSPDDAEAVRAAFADACRQVRVMPFLDGLPCSIAGLVLADHVAVMRPTELLVFGRDDGSFAYAGVATTWDPPVPLARSLGDVARRVGEHLRTTVRYRGAFVVDGVATADGFLPTELNPRLGASVGPQCGDFPIALVHLALVEGLDVVVDGPAFEAALQATAVERRFVRAMFPLPGAVRPGAHELAWDGEGFRRAVAGRGDARVRLGPSALGDVAVVELDPRRTPRGPAVAPRVAAAARWLDEALAVGLGRMVPAVAG